MDAEKGRPQTDAETMRLSDPRVFGGGDLVAPGRTVASSVLDGKRAAAAIAEAFPLGEAVTIPTSSRPVSRSSSAVCTASIHSSCRRRRSATRPRWSPVRSTPAGAGRLQDAQPRLGVRGHRPHAAPQRVEPR